MVVGSKFPFEERYDVDFDFDCVDSVRRSNHGNAHGGAASTLTSKCPSKNASDASGLSERRQSDT